MYSHLYKWKHTNEQTETQGIRKYKRKTNGTNQDTAEQNNQLISNQGD